MEPEEKNGEVTAPKMGTLDTRENITLDELLDDTEEERELSQAEAEKIGSAMVKMVKGAQTEFNKTFEAVRKAAMIAAFGDIENPEAEFAARFKELGRILGGYAAYCIFVEDELKKITPSGKYDELTLGLTTTIVRSYVEKHNIKAIEESIKEGRKRKLSQAEKNRVIEFIREFLGIEGISQRPGVKPDDLFPIPSSPASQFISRFLSTAGSDREIRTSNRNITIEEYMSGKDLTVTYKSQNSTMTLTYENISTLTSTKNDKSKKVWIYTLYNKKANCLDVVYPLKDLVDLGIYKSIESARLGFNSCMDRLMGLRIGGTTKQGKQTIRSEKGSIFIYRKIENNICTIGLNQYMNYDFLAQCFAYMPAWSFKLKTKPFNLIEYICLQARQNTKSIKNNGKFNLSFTSINDYLGQPTPKETVRHTEEIIDPILSAITHLEDNQEGTDYKFTPIYETNYINAVDFLRGYLEVEITGEMKTKLIERQVKKESEYHKSEKIRDRSQQKAIEK